MFGIRSRDGPCIQERSQSLTPRLCASHAPRACDFQAQSVHRTAKSTPASQQSLRSQQGPRRNTARTTVFYSSKRSSLRKKNKDTSSSSREGRKDKDGGNLSPMIASSYVQDSTEELEQNSQFVKNRDQVVGVYSDATGENVTDDKCGAGQVQNPSITNPPIKHAPKLPGTVRRPWEHEDAVLSNMGTTEVAESAYAFLVSRGLTELQAERLALRLDGEGSHFADTKKLEAQLCNLTWLLPGLDVSALLCKDHMVLNVDTEAAARRLIVLKRLLGNPDLSEVIMVAPQLLYAEEVEERVESCLEKLKSLLPSDYPNDRLQGLIIEAPTTVFRLDHFSHIHNVDQLPVDLAERLLRPLDSIDMSCLIS